MHRQKMPVRLLGWDDLRAKGIKDLEANRSTARSNPASFLDLSMPVNPRLGLSMK